MINGNSFGNTGFGGRPCVCLALALLALFAPNAFAEKMYAVTAYGVVDVVDTDEEKDLPPGDADETFTANGVTLNIWYEDSANTGFNDGTERKERLRDALKYVTGVLGETGTLDILVKESEFDASGFLAAAGTWFSQTKGFQNGTAFKRLTTGSKPFSTLEEIFVTVDWGWSWNTSTDPPTGSQFDLTSVLIHEITHGVGFLSLSNSNGTSSILGGGVYTGYDDELFTGNGTDLFTGSGASIVFEGTSSSLTGSQGGLEFRGTNAEAAWTFGTFPPVYAPSPWEEGSSISHLDVGGKIAGGAVMEPSISLGEEQRTFAPVEVGILIDMGWSNATLPSDTTPVITSDGGNGPGVDYATSNPSLTLAGTCAANTQEIQVNLATTGVTYTPGETTWSFAATLSEGANPFSVVAIDDVPNTSPADTITVTLDTAAPLAPVITTDGGNGAGVDYTASNSALTLAGTCDATSQEIQVNSSTVGVTYTPGETTWSFAATLSEGANLFSVVAIDAALNASSADTITITLTSLGLSAPIITTDGGNGAGVNYTTSDTSLTLVGTCDAISQEILVNSSTTGVTYTPGETTWSFSTTLSEGDNAFSVVAVDGLTASSADTITITLASLGLSAPIITTDGGNGAGVDYTTSEASLTLVGTCDAISQEILVNSSTTGVTYTPGETTWSFSTTLSEGDNAFSVIAVDGLSASPADSITVTLDTTAPAAPVITTDGGNGAGVDYTTSEASLTLAGTCDASSEEIQVNASVTAVTYTPGETTWSFPATLSEGANSFSVVAIDAAGNSSGPDSITVTLSVVNSAPVADAGPDQNASLDSTVTLDGTASSDANEDTLTYLWSVVSIPEGSSAALDDATSATPSFTPDVVGDYEFELVVNDSEEDSAPDRVVVSVGVCSLLDVAITFPTDNSTILIPAGAGVIPLTFTASTDCPTDTAQVEYSLDDVVLGSTQQAPYEVTLADLTQLTAGQHVLVASATSVVSTKAVVEDTVTFTVAEAAANLDSNANGLPDNAFTALAQDGDVWRAVVTEGMSGLRNVHVVKWVGTAPKAAGDAVFTVAIENAENVAQRVVVEVPRALLLENETGVLIIETASDLATLLGAGEAALIADEPSGGLVLGAHYVEISILVSVDDGANFTELDDALLAANPIHLTVEGMSISQNANVSIYSHPSYVDSDPATGLEIVIHTEDGGWDSTKAQNVEVATTSTEADLTSLSVFSVFGYPDINRDGLLNASDVQLVINGALGIDMAGRKADVNNDNAINATDVQLVINAALGIGL